jgi:hypothetical protein
LATKLVCGIRRLRMKLPKVFGGLRPGFEHLQLEMLSSGSQTGVVVWANAVQGQEHAHELGHPQGTEQPFAVAGPGELPCPLAGCNAHLIAQMAILDELLDPIG